MDIGTILASAFYANGLLPSTLFSLSSFEMVSSYPNAVSAVRVEDDPADMAEGFGLLADKFIQFLMI